MTKSREGHHRTSRPHPQPRMNLPHDQAAVPRDPVVRHNLPLRRAPHLPAPRMLHHTRVIPAPTPDQGQQQGYEKIGKLCFVNDRLTCIPDCNPRQSVSSIATAVPQVLPEAANRPTIPVMLQSPVSQMPMQPMIAHPPACTNCGHGQPTILIYMPFGPPTQPVAYTGTGGPVYMMQPPQQSQQPQQPQHSQQLQQPQPAPVNMTPQHEFPLNPPMTAITVPMAGCASDTTGTGASHKCHCGPGCQCIGCLEHLLNDATREYVRSAQESLYDFSSPYTGMQDIDPVAVPTAQSIANLTLSPEQTLAPEDFFFIDYPSGHRTYPG